MQRNKWFAEMGRERELRKIHDAKNEADVTVISYLTSITKSSASHYSEGEVYAAVEALYLVMRPYIKKIMPDKYKELKYIEDYIFSPPIIREKTSTACGKSYTQQYEVSPLMQNVGMSTLLTDFYRELDDIYTSGLDWGAPTPYKMDEMYIEDLEDVHEPDDEEEDVIE